MRQWGERRDYLWAYARPLSRIQDAAAVSGEVAEDADQMVLDLEAQGFHRVCGTVMPGVAVDAAFEKAGSPPESTSGPRVRSPTRRS